MKKIPNPLQDIYEACTSGTMKLKDENPIDFPRMLDVELTNLCNFKCVMCPTGQGTVYRPTGNMDFKLLLKVLDEAGDKRVPVRFIRWGEPLLYPLLQDALYEAKARGVICHINTNGSLLRGQMARFFVEIGLDSIKFSFQGVNSRTYEQMRNSNYFHKLLEKVRLLHQLREDKGSTKPFIQIGTTVTTEPEYIIRQFQSKVDNFTDAVYIGKTRDLQERLPSRVPYCECPEVFDKLSINYDGSVSACCGDYDNFTVVGDLKESSIQDVWNGERLAKFRKMLLEYRHNENYLCSRCARSDRE